MSLEKSNLKEKLISQLPSTGTLKLYRVKAMYNFAIDGGGISTLTPKKTATLPKNAVIVAGTVNSTTAVTSGGSATVGIGTDAGSSSTSILAQTAIASLGANALLNAVPVFATPVKLTAKANITFSIAVAALTAGVIEVVLFYYVASA